MSTSAVVESFDKIDKKDFNEYQIADALKAVAPENHSEVSFELKADLMAFSFSGSPRGGDELSQWGTYFGPMFVFGNADGTSTESPSIWLVTPEIIDYWQQKGKEAINPIIKARYLGLVFDFQKKDQVHRANLSRYIRIY